MGGSRLHPALMLIVTHLLDSAGFYVHHVSSVKVSVVCMWCESLESRVVWDFLCAG